MHTPAQIAKHPIHPMIVPIPIGLWIFSLVCDLVFAFGWGGETWRTVAFYTMAGGLVGGLVAAVPGFIDMLSLRAGLKKLALIHMTLNLIVVALYAINVWWRAGEGGEGAGPVWLSVLAIVLLSISGWLGGKMVYVHGVAVDTPPRPAVDTPPRPAPDARRERQHT